MFDIIFPESMGLLDPGPELIILILIVLILLFGSRKIPELARGLGRAMGEFKRGRLEIEKEIAQEYAPAATTQAKADSGALRAAKQLGIDIEGESETDVKRRIAEAVPSKDKASVIAVAKTLKLDVEGVGVEDLKRQILNVVR